jgi:hypothetical protein
VFEEAGQLFSFFTLLVGWPANAVSLPPGDVIWAKQACSSMKSLIVYIRIADLSLYKHWFVRGLFTTA